MTTVRFTVVDEASRSGDVLADIDASATADELRQSLQELGFQLPGLNIGARPVLPTAPVATLGLTHGSLVSGPTVRTTGQAIQDGMHLSVICGPSAGAWLPFPEGSTITVGRSGDLSIPEDPMLSKVHASFRSEAGKVYVRDNQSSNGTAIDGVRIIDEVEITPAMYVQVGSSVVALVAVRREDRAVLSSPEGAAYPMPRTFREALPDLPKEVRLPRAPFEGSSGGSSTWWRSLLPLVTGVGFAVATGKYIFLLLSALAPVIFAVDAWRQKRKRSSAQTTTHEEWVERAAEGQRSFEATWEEERRRLRASQPIGGAALLNALVQHRRLWERRPADSDFCSVTIGLGRVPSKVALVDSQSEVEKRSTEPMWGTPVAVDLLATGPIAVLGEMLRTRAVVRGLLLNLAVTHSPSDVRMWVFTDVETSHEWAAVRWLPHAMIDDQGCQIASVPESRGPMMSALRQIFDQRLEVLRPGQKSADLPIHVAVFDGAEVVRGRDFNEILARGASVGIICIIADSIVAPDGVMGVMRVGPEADRAVYESRTQPRIDEISSVLLSSALAESGARKLAALRPSAVGAASLSETSPRLAGLVGADTTTPEAVAARWRDTGMVSKVTVGVTAGARLAMDLLRDGPHGLVGGMTRSGKTEFLKTLITSAAWANHPDDLSFVIVDFKGGIDYTATDVLPHVLDVSSNQDLDGFERTIGLMAAELRRRQRIFEPLQVANLDAYRTARSRNPALVPIPRLIVLVDEFGEMLNNDVGREQLKQLESMARIGGGLGVHLLLITQNFEGQLPDQIAANAGFRVCFRVQDASHSKIVLNSGIASSVPASAKGRGYARMQDGEPFEFQSARVAGRRPDLQSRSTPVVLRLQLLDSLAATTAAQQIADVPAEETDMYRMFEIIRAAALISGWERSAVPWPKRLPDDLPLASVLTAHRSGEFPIGLADVPERQAQVTYSVSVADEHAALMGGPRADLNSVLITIASSMAATSDPSELHLYGIDFTGRGLGRISRLPHCGGVASQSETMSVRIARFLADEAARRRAELEAEGVTSLQEFRSRTGRSFPHLVLFIAGAEKLTGVGNYEEASAAAPFVASLVGQAGALGIQVVAAGLPTFVQYRPGSQIEHRLAFTAPDNAVYLGIGCPRPMLGELTVPRRGIDISRRIVFQAASLAAGAAGEADVFDALVARLKDKWPDDVIKTPPKRFAEVTWPIKLSVFLGAAGRPPARSEFAIPLGIDAETGETMWLVPADVGKVFFVTGGRRSGRSTALISIGAAAAAHGWSVIAASGSPASPLGDDGGPLVSSTLAEVDAALSRSRRPRLVVIDEVHRIDPNDPNSPKTLATADLVVVAGLNTTFSGTQRLLAELGLARTRNGLVLMPGGYTDVDSLGVGATMVKADAYKGKNPGQGLLGIEGELIDITIPLATTTR